MTEHGSHKYRLMGPSELRWGYVQTQALCRFLQIYNNCNSITRAVHYVGSVVQYHLFVKKSELEKFRKYNILKNKLYIQVLDYYRKDCFCNHPILLNFLFCIFLKILPMLFLFFIFRHFLLYITRKCMPEVVFIKYSRFRKTKPFCWWCSCQKLVITILLWLNA